MVEYDKYHVKSKQKQKNNFFKTNENPLKNKTCFYKLQKYAYVLYKL